MRVISISDEKPGPWRRCPLVYPPISIYLFQSQTRSQAPGDSVLFAVALASFSISISDEKPGPWRRRDFVTVPILPYIFQSQTRSQAPGDVDTNGWYKRRGWYFNLRREARPLATLYLRGQPEPTPLFQSQR